MNEDEEERTFPISPCLEVARYDNFPLNWYIFKATQLSPFLSLSGSIDGRQLAYTRRCVQVRGTYDSIESFQSIKNSSWTSQLPLSSRLTTPLMENENSFHAATAWSQYLPISPKTPHKMSSVAKSRGMDATQSAQPTSSNVAASPPTSRKSSQARRASCIENPPHIINSSTIYPYSASIPLTPPAEMHRNHSTPSLFDPPPSSLDWLAGLAGGSSSQSKSRGTTLVGQSASTTASSSPHGHGSRQGATSSSGVRYRNSLSIAIPPPGLDCPLFAPSSYPLPSTLIADYSPYSSTHETPMETSDAQMEEVNAILGIIPDPPTATHLSITIPSSGPRQPSHPSRYYPSPTSKGRLVSPPLKLVNNGNQIDSRLFGQEHAYPRSAPAWQTSFPSSIQSPPPSLNQNRIAPSFHSFPPFQPTTAYPLALPPDYSTPPRDANRPRSAPSPPAMEIDRRNSFQHPSMMLDRRGSLNVPMQSTPSYRSIDSSFPPSAYRSNFPPTHTAAGRRGSGPLPPPSSYHHPSGRVINRVSTGGISFVNFTAVDADALLAGVAPSGSSKRKREGEAELVAEKLRRGRRVFTV